MIYEDNYVWKLDDEPCAVFVRTLKVGDKIAVLSNDSNIPVYATIKSILPVFSKYTACFFDTHKTLFLPENGTILTDTGFELPQKELIVVCGKERPRIRAISNYLTAKKFYSILLDDALPIIVESGYVLQS